MVSALISQLTSCVCNPSKETKLEQKCRIYGLPKDFIVKQKLVELLFQKHLAEQINYFGHKNVLEVKKVDKEEHLLFAHTPSKMLAQYSEEYLEDLEEFYQTGKLRNWSFRVTDLKRGPHFEEKAFKDVSFEEFEMMVNQYGKEHLLIVEEKSFLTIFELFEKNILNKGKDQSYLLEDDHIMTDRGFMKKNNTKVGIDHLYFIDAGKAEINRLYFDVYLHAPSSDFFMDQNTHASCRITLPNGQSASLGFYPDEEINSLRLEEFQVRHESPDHYIFLKKGRRSYYVRYIIESKENIDKFCKTVHQFMQETDQKTYQMFHKNCACLLKELVHVAKTECKAKKIGTNYHPNMVFSVLNKISLIFVKFMMALIECFKFRQLNPFLNPIHLPRDLMLLS